jgi:hypothetical protein
MARTRIDRCGKRAGAAVGEALSMAGHQSRPVYYKHPDVFVQFSSSRPTLVPVNCWLCVGDKTIHMRGRLLSRPAPTTYLDVGGVRFKVLLDATMADGSVRLAWDK